MKKHFKLLSAFLCLSFLAVLCACTNKQKTPDYTIPDGASYISDEEYKALTEGFFGETDDKINIARQFLSCSFEDVRDIDLYALFYIGIPGESEVSDEELALLSGTADCPYSRIKTSELEAVLKKYAGISLEETEKKNIDRMEYLEAYDAYYIQHGDTNHPFPVFTGGYVEENGQTVLLYDEGCCVTLKKTSDGEYKIVKNFTTTPMP